MYVKKALEELRVARRTEEKAAWGWEGPASRAALGQETVNRLSAMAATVNQL